jgi:hypothetical protein
MLLSADEEQMAGYVYDAGGMREAFPFLATIKYTLIACYLMLRVNCTLNPSPPLLSSL